MPGAQRYYPPYTYEPDANGVPIARARLFFYQTGTSTPQDTYSDVGLNTKNTNPVVADANGRFPTIWLSGSNAYRVDLYTAATDLDPVGSQIWSADPVGPAAGGVSSNNVGMIGEIRAWAGYENTIPAGWLACHGQIVSRTLYADLFAAIGTLWGAGDGSSTFNLPDCRGRALFGPDAGTNRLTSDASGFAAFPGASGGSQWVQQHNHDLEIIITDPGHTHVTDARSWPVASSGPLAASGNFAFNLPEAQIFTTTTGITGSGSAKAYGTGDSQNIPPAAVVNWIVYSGV